MIKPIMNFIRFNINTASKNKYSSYPVFCGDNLKDSFEINGAEHSSANISSNSIDKMSKSEFINNLSSINDVHCPICGEKMLSQNEFEKLLQKAEQIETPKQYLKLLNEYKDYLPKEKLCLINNAHELIKNNPDANLKEFIIDLKNTGDDYVDNIFQKNIDYLKSHIDSGIYIDADVKKMQKCINEFQILKNNNHESQHFIYSDAINIMRNNFNNFSGNNINQIYNHLKNNFKAVASYKTAVNIIADDKSSTKDITMQAFSRIFKSSVARVSEVQSNFDFLKDETYNSILICDNCEKNKQGSYKFYPHNVDYTKLNKNFEIYANDIVNAICTGDLRYPEYFNKVTSLVYGFSSHNVSISKLKLSKYKDKIYDFQQKVNFKPMYLNDYITCSCCGTPMISYHKINEINDNIKKAHNFQELNKIVQDNKLYINKDLNWVVDMMNELSKERTDITFDDAILEIQLVQSKFIHENFKELVDSIRKKAKNQYIGTPKQRMEYNKFADEIEKKYVNQRQLAFINYGNYKDLCIEYNVIDHKGDFRLTPIIRDKMKHNINRHNLFHPPFSKIEFAGSAMQAFVRSMFNMSVHTMDHIEAKSLNGDNSLNNLIGMCHSCNTEKGILNIRYWKSVHPEMKFNTIKNLRIINNLAKNGKLEGYDNYAKDVSEHIYEVTEGAIDVRRPFKDNNKK